MRRRADQTAWPRSIQKSEQHGFTTRRFRYVLTLFPKSFSSFLHLSFIFSSFPHGTCSLWVSCQHFALDRVYHPFYAAFPNNPTLRNHIMIDRSRHVEPHPREVRRQEGRPRCLAIRRMTLAGCIASSIPFPFQRFQVLFNSPSKALCIFPSRYLLAIGLVPVFSFRLSLPPVLGCTPSNPNLREDIVSGRAGHADA